MTRMPQTKPAPQHRPHLQQPHAEGVILGVDSHQDAHVAAVITNIGAPVADRAFPATAAGYRQLLAWARRFGRLRRAGVEGTGCYGAALARYLRTHGITVIEVNRPDRAARRRRGKPMSSTRRPPPTRCCPAGQPPSPRPATGRWR